MTRAAILALALLAAPAIAQPADAPRGGTLGVLDKRQGTTAEFMLGPGEAFRFGRLSGVLHACQTTEPHETPESGAFVQVDERIPTRAGAERGATRRVFSGWLFARSPSLNPFVHPVYDVWLKSCTMARPAAAPSPGSAGATRGSGPALLSEPTRPRARSAASQLARTASAPSSSPR